MPAPERLKNDDIFNAYNQEVAANGPRKGFHIFKPELLRDFSNCQLTSPWEIDHDQNPATRMSLAQKNYKKLEEILIIHRDKQNGIITVFDHSFPAAGNPNGIPCVRRDARQAIPLAKRLDPNHFIFHADDTLLRALQTTRALDYLLQKRAENSSNNQNRVEYYWGEQEKLQHTMSSFLHTVTDIQNRLATGLITEAAAKKELQHEHEKFNAHLCGIIHQNHFDRGLKKKNAAEYEKLLNHLRQMASVLDPAPAQQTLSQDKQGVTHIQTAYPITKKTEKQQEAMQTMQRVVAKPSKKELDYHTGQSEAYQEMNVAFYDLLTDDTRRLPSQMRKTHLACGVRNGYLCKDEWIFPAKEDKPEHSVQGEAYIRCATVAYVGKGETDKRKQEFAHENIQQLIRMYNLHVPPGEGKVHRPHILLLNTFSPLEDQDQMYNQTRAGLAKNKIGYFSYVPTNIEGTLRHPEFSKIVSKHPKAPMAISKPFHKSARLRQAIEVLEVVESEPGVFIVFACASGRDRTGALDKGKKLVTAYRIYQQHNIMTSIEELDYSGTMAGHEAALATLEAPGSYGLKTDSIPGGHFGAETVKHTFLKTADTNKNQPIDEETLKLELAKKRAPDIEHDFIKVAVKIRSFAERRDWNPFTRSNSVKAALWLELADALERAQHDKHPQTMKKILENWSQRSVVVDKATGTKKKVEEIMKEQRNRFQSTDSPGETESSKFQKTLAELADQYKVRNTRAR